MFRGWERRQAMLYHELRISFRLLHSNDPFSEAACARVADAQLHPSGSF